MVLIAGRANAVVSKNRLKVRSPRARIGSLTSTTRMLSPPPVRSAPSARLRPMPEGAPLINEASPASCQPSTIDRATTFRRDDVPGELVDARDVPLEGHLEVMGAIVAGAPVIPRARQVHREGAAVVHVLRPRVDDVQFDAIRVSPVRL
jgi:hypothetical protein